MKIRNLVLVVCAGSIGVSFADVVSNIYTVTSSSAASYTSPELLDELEVSCSDTTGKAPTTKTFAALAAEGFGGPSIFCKKGAGWLQSSVKMSSFLGEIRIEEGGFIVTTNLMTGADSYDSAPIVRVSSGATFMLRATAATCAANKLKLYNEFYLVGDGFQGMGAMCSANGNSQYGPACNGPWHLESDVTIYRATSQRWDVGDTTGNKRFFIDMQGHDLRYVKANGASSSADWVFSVGTQVKNPGSILVDGQSVMFQASGDFEGDASNELTFTNGCSIHMLNVNTTSKPGRIPWQVRIHSGASLLCDGTQCGYYATNANSFVGPIEIGSGTLKVSGEKLDAIRGTTFHQSLTGAGGLFANNCWLQFVNGGKDLTGPIVVDGTLSTNELGCGLAFWSRDSVPLQCEKIALTNAQIRFVETKEKNWNFPPLEFHVSSGEREISPAAEGGFVAGLKKTGAGTLVVSSPYSITGVTEVVEGTLRIGQCPNVGLYCGQCLATNTPTYFAPLGQNIPVWQIMHNYGFEFTNRIDYGLTALTTAGDSLWKGDASQYKYVMVTYAGYIWNRSNETKKWTFAGAAGSHTTFRFDDEERYFYSSYQTGKKATFDVTPGPHKVYWSTYAKTNEGGPEGKNWTNMDWKINGKSAGIMYDPQGRDSTSAADYIYMIDPGDGSLFTQSTNETVAIGKAAAIRSLRFGETGVLDVYGNAYVVDKLVGVGGTLTNSVVSAPRLTVTDSWLVTNYEIGRGTPLRAHIPLVFSDGAVLKVADDVKLRNGTYVILSADEPIAGCPILESSETTRSLTLRKSADGRALTLTRSNGFVLIYR